MTDGTSLAAEQAPLESVIKGEVMRMYEEVADNPEVEFHFFHGRVAAELFDYERDWLERAPEGAVASFAGVGNPHLRTNLKPGETVLDLGSGAGLDSIIAAWQVGLTGRVIGVDINPTMCAKAEANAKLNRRCSPGGRGVRDVRAGRFQTGEVGRGTAIPLP